MADAVLSAEWVQLSTKSEVWASLLTQLERVHLSRSWLTFDEVETLYRMVQAYKEAQNG